MEYIVSDSFFIIRAKEWVLFIVFGSLMTNYAKAAGSEKKIVVKGGLIERPERMILLFAIILSYALSYSNTIYLIALMAILTNITAIQRIMPALKEKTRRS